MPYNAETLQIFHRPGVNPQSMNSGISGDTFVTTLQPNDYGQHLAAVIDGAWVKGFDDSSLVPDIAQWSSQNIADDLILCLYHQGDTCHTLPAMLTTCLTSYRSKLEELYAAIGLTPQPPETCPGSTFALALFNADGSLDIAQLCDGLIAFELTDGHIRCQTPNQPPPGINHIHGAMFTGDATMLADTFFHTYAAEDLYNVIAVWLMSDGAFKQGDRGRDLLALHQLGPETYYEDVLMARFDNTIPSRQRYAENRIPMDVTILRIPL